MTLKKKFTKGRLANLKKKSSTEVNEERGHDTVFDVENNKSKRSLLSTDNNYFESPSKRGRGTPRCSRSSTTELNSRSPTPTRRSRGRPKKLQTDTNISITDISLDESSSSETPTPIRRGRGRPKKLQTDTNISFTDISLGESSCSETSDRRGRCCRRNTPQVDVSSRSPTPNRKGRGRPRKLQFEATSLPTEETSMQINEGCLVSKNTNDKFIDLQVEKNNDITTPGGRRRGRPRKIQQTEESTPSHTPERRHSHDSPSSMTNLQYDESGKSPNLDRRGSGRPRNTPQVDVCSRSPTPDRRSRGRPRKLQFDATTSATEETPMQIDEGCLVSENIVNKFTGLRIGRESCSSTPKKGSRRHSEENPPIELLSRSPTPTRRGRGRPKKHQAETSTINFQTSVSVLTNNSIENIIRGSFNQAHPKFQGSAGVQCTANAAMALAYQNFTNLTDWSVEIVDEILNYGNELYIKSIQTRIQPRDAPNINTNYLEIGELCSTFVINNRIGVNLSINQGRSIDNLLGLSGANVKLGIIDFFSENTSGILMCCNKSIAIFKYNSGEYCVFDSHSCDEFGFSSAEGLACFLRYRNVEDLGNHFITYYGSSRADEQFSIFPVIVTTTLDLTNFNIQNNLTLSVRTTQDSFNIHNRSTRQRQVSTVNEQNRNFSSRTYTLGELNEICQFCRALYYSSELVGSLCCNHGKIKLGNLEQNDFPELLKALLTNNHPKSKQFLKKIRTYNSRLAFASVSMNREHLQGQGQSVIVISGVVYHNLGMVDERDVKFGTIYFCDPDDINIARYNETANSLEIDLNILKQIEALFRQINPFAGKYKQMKNLLEEHKLQNPGVEPKLAIRFHTEFPNLDRRRYNRPVNENEIGAAFVSTDGELPPPGELIIYRHTDDGQPQVPKKIPKVSAIADPLCYPILFPRGELGWDFHIRQHDERGDKRVTMRQFYSYHLVTRQSIFNSRLLAGKLTQQFIIDAYSKVEGNRLDYLRQNQKQIRAEAYAGLQDYVARRAQGQGNPDAIGRLIVLPSSFTCGQRYMTNNYQDSMAIVCRFGKPSLFVTMTCNPKWPEITAELGKTNDGNYFLYAQDRPDIVVRVFKKKLDELKRMVIEEKLFGEVAAWIAVIEFQKRGLPHAHILITLISQDKIREPHQIDRIIRAEIPNEIEEPELFQIITTMNIHGPCGPRNLSSPCMKDGVCSKKYPQNFSEMTMLTDGKLPIYRRRNDGRSVEVTVNRKVFLVDNRDVVPYNPILSVRFASHINVLLVSTVENVKYLFKYITKGPDAALITFENPETNAEEYVFDEIRDFQDTRYLSSCEAMWRLFSFSIVDKSHTVIRLIIHLPGEKLVYFEEGDEEGALGHAAGQLSMLEAYFKLNADDPEARGHVYPNIPYFYRFHKGKWTKRMREKKIVTRMFTISPRWVEKFHLRILLLHVPGATSYEDLLTVNGHLCETFKESAERRLLTVNDDEWRRTLDEAAATQMPGQMRKLFSHLLCLCSVGCPVALWNEYNKYMIEDYLKKGFDIAEATRRTLIRIEDLINYHGRNLGEFGIEQPLRLPIDNVEDFYDDDEFEQVADAIIDNIETSIVLNELQQRAFDTVVQAVRDPDMFNRYFYLQGSAGTGKTFLYNHIISVLSASGILTISVAFTGIAALLLKNGRTAHSAFKLPFNLTANSNSSMKAQSEEAAFLRRVQLIVWDEISMASSPMLNCVDRLLQYIRNNNRPFGGVAMLFGGDIRQLLPVAPFQVKQQELCFINSENWKHVQVLKLTENQRVDPEERDFANWLLKLGDGSLKPEIDPSLKKGNIPLDSIVVPDRCLTEDIIREVYGDVNFKDSQLFQEECMRRTILCPTNSHCRTINEKLLSQLQGEVTTFLSVDSVVTDDEQERANFPEEYLNSLSVSGMPDHKLCLKKGTPVMLLRNFSIKDGLINGTRLIVTSFTGHLLIAVIATGQHKNKQVYIPKIDVTSPENLFPFIFQRRQFPVKVCFAMTINKSQGQTFEKIGIYLPSPVFSHGQLYVAFSRARRWDAVKVEVHNKERQGKLIRNNNTVFTRNIVYRELVRRVFQN